MFDLADFSFLYMPDALPEATPKVTSLLLGKKTLWSHATVEI